MVEPKALVVAGRLNKLLEDIPVAPLPNMGEGAVAADVLKPPTPLGRLNCEVAGRNG